MKELLRGKNSVLMTEKKKSDKENETLKTKLNGEPAHKHQDQEDTGSVYDEKDSLKEELEKLIKEKAELQDLYMRKHADFENYRKRMSKEKTESLQYANADLIEKMLDVLDNFERAKKAALENNDIKTVVEGINMIENNLISLLSSKGLIKLDSVNQPFNPEHHLAITMEESEDLQEAKVIEEFQSGYLLHERLLRAAKVKVAMPKNSTTSDK